jgi:hypothetical protein
MIFGFSRFAVFFAVVQSAVQRFSGSAVQRFSGSLLLETGDAAYDKLSLEVLYPTYHGHSSCTWPIVQRSNC